MPFVRKNSKSATILALETEVADLLKEGWELVSGTEESAHRAKLAASPALSSEMSQEKARVDAGLYEVTKAGLQHGSPSTLDNTTRPQDVPTPASVEKDNSKSGSATLVPTLPQADKNAIGAAAGAGSIAAASAPANATPEALTAQAKGESLPASEKNVVDPNKVAGATPVDSKGQPSASSSNSAPSAPAGDSATNSTTAKTTQK